MPPWERDTVWKTIAHLTYKQHGGSGTNLTLSDVLELEWERAVWWCNWLHEQRGLEKDAIDRAYAEARSGTPK